MPEYLSPGVYVEEVNTGPRPIAGVSTSTAALIGPTERGPLVPRMVTNWLEYQRWFGGHMGDLSFVPHAAQGFFDNGGQRLFVARVVGQNAAFAEQNFPPLHVHAIGPGDWADRVYIRITNGSKTTQRADYRRLTILYFSVDRPPVNPNSIIDPLNPASANDPDYVEPERIEDYDNVVHTPGAANSIETVVNSGSQLVRVWLTATGALAPTANDDYVRLANGTNNGSAIDGGDYAGNMNPIIATPGVNPTLFGQGQGLAAMSAIDELNLLLAPDEVNPNITNADQITVAVINQCESLKDRYAIVSAPRSAGSSLNTLRPPRDTSYAGYYYPWIEIYDPQSRGPILIPPSGHVAGIIARTDIERGVHKAPANEVVRGARNLETPVTKEIQAILNPRGVNCIRDFRSDGRGIRLWGARNMASDPLWKYINVRRLFLFIEESIDEGTQWVVFEPNDEPLWAQVRRTISTFLFGVWRSGALMGRNPEEAFFVKCDRTTMTQDDVDNGRLVCYIGVAPVKPAEFVIFRISQKTLEAEPV